MDELSLSFFIVIIGVPNKNEEKLGPLSPMKPESEITVLGICGKEHTFQITLDNSPGLEDTVDPWKKAEKEMQAKTRVSKLIGTKMGKSHKWRPQMEKLGVQE